MQQELEALHEIVLPPPVSYVPQTTAWLGVFVVALMFVAWTVLTLRRRARANRYRRLALARLEDIRLRGAGSELPDLVKRTVLCFRPRAEVASLSGEEWLRYLDSTDSTENGKRFTEGPGRLLFRLAYEPPESVKTQEIDELHTLLAHWIRRHDVRV